MFSKNTANIISYKEKDSNCIGVFNKNPQLLFLQKKTERLVAALYMVSGLLPEKEPVRRSLREQGVALIATVLSFITATGNQQENEEQKAQSLLAETLMLLQVSRHAGLFSDMNASVLQQECQALAALFADPAYRRREGEAGTAVETSLFPDDFFVLGKPDSMPGTSAGVAGVYGRDAENERKKNNSVVSGYPSGSRLENFSGATRETMKDITLKNVKDISRARNKKTAEKSADRQKSLLILLREKGAITIKDAIRVITDFGEKTIQRDLTALVDEGIVKKSGERRWTTYSLG